MPLPTRDQAWPPTQLHRAYEQWAVLDAWYTSDVDALEWLYAVNRLQTKTSTWGQVARRFWGGPTPMVTTQRPVKMHVPIAAEISRMSSQLLFGQLPDVHFGDMDGDDDDKGLTKTQGDAATARLMEILDDSAHAVLLQGAEYDSAHGGVYIKITWDKDVVPDKPFITAIASDGAVPEFRWDRLAAVTFWRELAPVNGQNAMWKLLERHEPGRVTWGLYSGATANSLGQLVPLTEHPDTEYLADIVDGDAGVDTGSDLLTAVYVPNIAPNGAWRKMPGMSPLGRSDYAGVEDLFDDLDETYTSMQRDFRLGKARMLVPKGMMNTGQPGQGAIFNADQEVFVEAGQQVGSLNPKATAGSADSFFQYFQPNIRTTEHLDKITHIIARIYAACGYSPQSFGDGDAKGTTATEVVAREKLTVLTRSAKILYWRPQLSALFAALMDVDQFVFNGPGRGQALPQIEFADAATEDPEVQARTLQLLTLAEAASTQTRVELLHPDWDDDQVAAEVTRIKDDLSMLPDPTLAHLWAAQSPNGSATGGVQAGMGGITADPAQLAAAKFANAHVTAEEANLDGAAK